jgi:hypothetical protein
MGQFDSDRTVVSIKNRMKALGIDLDRYIGVVTNKWDDTPGGFGFTCKDKASYSALMFALVQNLNFGSDSMLGGSKHLGASFREVNSANSLHIILSSRPDPSMSKPSDPVRATCSIHLDSVSPVAGRDPKTGLIIYDTGKVLQHLATDLKRTPLIVPSSEQGLVFGFRF